MFNWKFKTPEKRSTGLVYAGNGDLTEMTRDHVREMLGKYPYSLEFSDRMPRERFNAWDAALNKTTEIYMSDTGVGDFPSERTIAHYGTCWKNGNPDNGMFYFFRDESNWWITRDMFSDIIVTDAPFKTVF